MPINVPIRCPTCAAVASGLNAATIHGKYIAYWCPQCGTLVEDGGEDYQEPIAVSVPGVVELIRKLARNPNAGEANARPDRR